MTHYPKLTKKNCLCNQKVSKMDHKTLISCLYFVEEPYLLKIGC
jgi:hypothetical protein